MSSLLPTIVALGAAALFAIALTRGRPITAGSTTRGDAARALTLALAIQALHFSEEATTGFHARFPALVGLPAMPFSIFVGFNLVWLAVWALSIPALRNGRNAALFPAWFLAIAGMLNGIAHPGMALAAGGYFPGLVTSPLIGLASLRLWGRLRATTEVEPDR